MLEIGQVLGCAAGLGVRALRLLLGWRGSFFAVLLVGDVLGLLVADDRRLDLGLGFLVGLAHHPGLLGGFGVPCGAAASPLNRRTRCTCAPGMKVRYSSWMRRAAGLVFQDQLALVIGLELGRCPTLIKRRRREAAR